MAPKKRRTDALPKAPLAEVVFELRWVLQGGVGGAAVLQSDPGLLPLLDRFTNGMKKAGFGTIKDMSHPLQTGPYGVARRFFKRADMPFPIMQIGPGIFATNESSEYDWKTFKKQVTLGLRALLNAYPKLDFFLLRPNIIELRYVDVFPESLVGNAALFPFLERGTLLKVELPPMLNDRKIFGPDPIGRFIYRSKLKGRKSTEFHLDLGSGKNSETTETVVHMETKIISSLDGVPSLNSRTKFLREVEDWLEMAHRIISPFFSQLVRPEVLKNYRIGK